MGIAVQTPPNLEDIERLIGFYSGSGVDKSGFVTIWESIKSIMQRLDIIEKNGVKENKDNIIFTMTDQQLDDFLYDNGFDRTSKNRAFAIQAIRKWIEEYDSEGNLSLGAEGFMTRILEDDEKSKWSSDPKLLDVNEGRKK